MPFSIGPSFYLSLTCSLFPFFLFFFFLLIFFLFVFLFPFAVLRCPLLFVWSFSLFFQYEVSLLLRFSFRFPAPLVADSVILSRCYPPALLASLQICVPLVCMYSSCVLFFLAFLFLSVFTFLFMIFFFFFSPLLFLFGRCRFLSILLLSSLVGITLSPRFVLLLLVQRMI